jgi:hypothetical protein
MGFLSLFHHLVLLRFMADAPLSGQALLTGSDNMTAANFGNFNIGPSEFFDLLKSIFCRTDYQS